MAEYKGEVILNSNEPSGQYVPYHGEVDYSKIGTPAEKSQIASEQDTRSWADKIVSAGLKGAAFTAGAEGTLAKLAPVGNALRVGGELSTYSAGQTAKTALGGAGIGVTDEAVHQALDALVPDWSPTAKEATAFGTVMLGAGAVPAAGALYRSLTPVLSQSNRLVQGAQKITNILAPDVEKFTKSRLEKLAKGDVSEISGPALEKILKPFGEKSAEIKATIEAKDNAIKELKVKYSKLTQDEKTRLDGLIQDREKYIEGLGSQLPGTKSAFNYGRDRFLPDNPSKVGAEARNEIVTNYEKAIDTRAKAASTDYKEMIDDAEAKEKRGMTVLMTDSHKQMVAYIDNLLTKVNLREDFNNPLMTLRTALTKGAEINLSETDRKLIALRKGISLDQVPEKMFLQPTMEGMEIVRRKLNDVAFPAIGQPQGFNAIGAKNAEKIGEYLDKSMSEFSGYGTNNPYLKYKENYKKNSEYINKIKTTFGEQFIQKEDAFWKVPAGELIKKASASPEAYDHFVGMVGKENADAMISKYFVHEFESLLQGSTKSASEFMKKNEAVLMKVSANKDIQNVLMKMRIAEDDIEGFKTEIKKLQGAHPVETEAMKGARTQHEAIEKENVAHAVEAKEIDKVLEQVGNDPERLAKVVKLTRDPIWQERIGQFVNTPEQKKAFVDAVAITLKDTPPNQVVEVFKRDILPTIRRIGISGGTGEVGLSYIESTIKSIERLQNRSVKEKAMVDFTRRLLGAGGSQTTMGGIPLIGNFVERPVTTVKGIYNKLTAPNELPPPLK